MSIDIASIEAKLAAFSAAVAPLLSTAETLLPELEIFLPATVTVPLNAAIATIKTVEAAAPTLVADFEKAIGDLETAVKAVNPPAAPAAPAPAA